MNIKILGIALLSLIYVACNQTASHDGHNCDGHNHEVESHEGHNHDEHNHDEHNHADHEEHSCDGHNHSEHEGHNHAEENHQEHDHEGHNHEEHSHEEHSCDEHNHDEHEGHNHEENGANTIVFTKVQSAKIDFVVEQPQQEPFGRIIKTVAKIEPARGEESVLTATSAGIVLFSDNSFLEGKKITQGQTVLTLSSGELAENNISVRLAEAKSNYESAKANYERESELVKDKLISEHEFYEAKKEFKSAEAIYNNLTKNFSSDGQLIKSSLNGYIKNIYVANGQYVEEGQALVSISQNKHLLLTAQVQQKYLEYLPSVVSANIKTLHNNRTYSFDELNGKVLSYGKSASNNSFMIPVNLQIANKAGFAPGTLTEVYLKAVTNSKALTVPNSSLLEEQGLFYVFVEVTPELFEKREVKIGGTDGIRTELTLGVNANDRIVTKGAMQVKLAQASAALDPHAGHVH
ncbi:MAG: efflux RND transporter periplasmic adaptor subunit [Flavobacteriales bacterium]|jgi:RND family efflux transporter MFP subunit|nr:efflux RND transporter periplasmic adaptor subunit [Bacteroidia bacterium]